MSTKASYGIDFSFPPGWVQLPVMADRKALQRDKKLQAWSLKHARTMLGADAAQEQVEHRAKELGTLTYGARARNATYGLAFYTPSSPGPVALLDFKHLIPDRTYPQLTFEVLQELYAKPSADTIGDIEEKRVDLPSGPALRVQRKRAEPGDPTGESFIMEGVTYAIRPPGTDDAIIMVMTWRALQLGDRLAAMAEAIAKTVKLMPE